MQGFDDVVIKLCSPSRPFPLIKSTKTNGAVNIQQVQSCIHCFFSSLVSKIPGKQWTKILCTCSIFTTRQGTGDLTPLSSSYYPRASIDKQADNHGSRGGHSPRKRTGMLGWRRETFNLRYSANSLNRGPSV